MKIWFFQFTNAELWPGIVSARVRARTRLGAFLQMAAYIRSPLDASNNKPADHGVICTVIGYEPEGLNYPGVIADSVRVRV